MTAHVPADLQKLIDRGVVRPLTEPAPNEDPVTAPTRPRSPVAVRHRQAGALLVADAIEALHQPLERQGDPMCRDCLQPHPCPTVQVARDAAATA